VLGELDAVGDLLQGRKKAKENKVSLFPLFFYDLVPEKKIFELSKLSKTVTEKAHHQTHRIKHVEVVVLGVDLEPQRRCPLGHVASRHLGEQVERLLNGTVPVGRPLARLPGRLDLLLRLVADVGSVPLDEVDRDVMELAEIVRGVRDLRGRERRGGGRGKEKGGRFFF
jgi:hypothetical protein